MSKLIEFIKSLFRTRYTWPMGQRRHQDPHWRKTDPKVEAMVNRFLAWNLPKSVCSDRCVTEHNCPYQRTGTMLLTATEAQQMIEYLLAPET